MGLDTRYIPAFTFLEPIIDKDTGFPLAAGIVTFYKDQARTELKKVYRITGTPPNYTYTELPNPFTLSSVGTFVDSGADIVPYLFPYDGDGNEELYFIDVKSAGAVDQFTREGQPNVDITTTATLELENFIPNGQFWLHNNLPATQISQGVTEVAPGGWTFERPSGSTATDFVTFNRFGSSVSNPTGNPRYEIRVWCTAPGSGDTFKGLRVKFPDVNRFASTTQKYTFSFTAKNTSVSSQEISSKLIKNYGTGGSSETITALDNSQIVTNNYNTFNAYFVFGTNESKTIGHDDDDFSQLSVEFPTSSTFDIVITCFGLSVGQIPIEQVPDETVNQFNYRSLFSSILRPARDGNDIGLPIKFTRSGLSFDDSDVGKIFMAVYDEPHQFELVCDGSEVDGTTFSPEGVPYLRLYNKIQKGLMPVWGTALHYVLAIPNANILDLKANSAGATTSASDGTIPTGFTFVDIVADPYHVEITMVGGGSIPAGAFFNFYTTNGDNFIVWYEKDGVGTQPTDPATKYIKLRIGATDTAQSIQEATSNRINLQYYLLPDFRGAFIRAWDDGRGTDPDAASRTANAVNLPFTGDANNTYQADEFKDHLHTIAISLGSSYSGGSEAALNIPNTTMDTGSTGGAETRAKNYYQLFVIKY